MGRISINLDVKEALKYPVLREADPVAYGLFGRSPKG